MLTSGWKTVNPSIQRPRNPTLKFDPGALAPALCERPAHITCQCKLRTAPTAHGARCPFSAPQIRHGSSPWQTSSLAPFGTSNRSRRRFEEGSMLGSNKDNTETDSDSASWRRTISFATISRTLQPFQPFPWRATSFLSPGFLLSPMANIFAAWLLRGDAILEGTGY